MTTLEVTSTHGFQDNWDKRILMITILIWEASKYSVNKNISDYLGTYNWFVIFCEKMFVISALPTLMDQLIQQVYQGTGNKDTVAVWGRNLHYEVKKRSVSFNGGTEEKHGTPRLESPAILELMEKLGQESTLRWFGYRIELEKLVWMNLLNLIILVQYHKILSIS